MSQARAPSHRTTRVTQKVKEAKLMRAKLKGKGKAKVDEETMEEVQKEKVERLKAEIAVLQENIDKLESSFPCPLFLHMYHSCILHCKRMKCLLSTFVFVT
jgi:hypothetical protein